MCIECHRINAKNYWRCIMQLYQNTKNKNTYLYLEQLILKYKEYENVLGIKPVNDELDLYFDNGQRVRIMVNLFKNTAQRCTLSVEIAPLSKDSLVCLLSKLRNQLGNFSVLCLNFKVAQHARN